MSQIVAKRNQSVGIALIVCLVLASCARTPAEKEARFMQRGKDFAQKHEYARAVLEFRNAVKVMPKDAEPIYQLALVYMAERDYRTAFQLLKKTVDVNPKYDQAQLLIAKFQSGAKDPIVVNEAKQRVQDVLLAKPGNTDALDTLAALDMKLGKTDDAEQALQTAIAKSPGDLGSAVQLANIKIKANDLAGAEAVLKAAVQNAPNSSDAALTLGVFYLKHGRTAEAEPLIQRAVELNPKSPTALALTAQFQMERGQMDQAEKTMRRISELPDPSLKPAHAAFLFREGKHDEALAELNTLVKNNPDDRNLRSTLVSTYMQAGKPQDAQRVLDEALKRNPKDTDALLQRSTFFLNTGKLAETETDLHSILASNPESADAHYGLARVAALRGSTLVQRQELNEALRLNPKLLAARIDLSTILRTKDPKAALTLLNEAPPDQKELPTYLVERNWVLIASNDGPELRKSLDASLAKNRTPEFLYQDAILRFTQKDYLGTRASLQESLKQNPDNMSAVDLLARTYATQGDPKKALEVVQEYAAQRPKSPFLGSLVGIWQSNLKQFEPARESFSSVIASNPDYMPARLALAEVDATLGKLDEANHTLQEALAKQPANTQIKFRLGELEERTGNHAAARDHFRTVVQSEPTNVNALNDLAYVLAPDNPDEALKYAQSAVELAPNDPAAQDTLGWVYYRKSLYDNALMHFKSAVSTQATATRRYHLALAYSKVGNKQLAQENLSAALQLDPKLSMPESLAN